MDSLQTQINHHLDVAGECHLTRYEGGKAVARLNIRLRRNPIYRWWVENIRCSDGAENSWAPQSLGAVVSEAAEKGYVVEGAAV